MFKNGRRHRQLERTHVALPKPASRALHRLFQAPFGPYALAILVVVVLAAVRGSLDGELEDRSRFLLFLPGAVLIAWIAGAGPGLLTLIGGALAGIFIFPATGEKFAARPGDLLSAALYLVSGVACIGIVQDLRRTQRKLSSLNVELEERVRERTAELDRALRDMQRFTYAVAHNMRSPLRAIVGYGRIILEDSGDRLDRPTSANLVRIEGAAKRMSRLIDDLLAYARFCGDDPDLERIDVSSVAEDITQQVLAAHGPPEAAVDIQPDLWAWADRRQIWGALDQVIDNAVKYRSPGRELCIKIRGESTPNGCAVVIEDNGIGFEMCYAAKVFEPFERLHADEAYSGTGIGLAIVARIMEKHHGHVRIESIPDRGTKVFLTLPHTAACPPPIHAAAKLL